MHDHSLQWKVDRPCGLCSMYLDSILCRQMPDSIVDLLSYRVYSLNLEIIYLGILCFLLMINSGFILDYHFYAFEFHPDTWIKEADWQLPKDVYVNYNVTFVGFRQHPFPGKSEDDTVSASEIMSLEERYKSLLYFCHLLLSAILNLCLHWLIDWKFY